MKPLLQARYRGQPEWTWEYSTRGYVSEFLETAKKPTYKWLEEAKKRDKPLQVQVVIVDSEKRWGEVVWEDFHLKDEFYSNKEAERCQIVRDITKDLLEEECQTEGDKCRIAKEIATKTITKACLTVDEKRLKKFEKLCKRFPRIKIEDIEKLPEGRREQVIKMFDDMESHFLWLLDCLEYKKL